MSDDKKYIADPGIYKLQIVDVQLNKPKQYLKLIMDFNDTESEWFEHGREIEQAFGHRYAYVQAILSFKETVIKSFWWKVLNILEENGIDGKENLQKVINSDYADLIGLECFWNLQHEEYQAKNGSIRKKFTAFPELILKKDIKKATKKKKPKSKVAEPEEGGASVNQFDEVDEMPF